jgi:Tfp pilus assembly protein PilW
MVALVISLVTVAAASYAYLATRQSSRATDANSQLNEQGRQALDFMLREVQMAWSLPAVRAITGQAFADRWAPMFPVTVAAGSVRPYVQFLTGGRHHGIFGCSGNLATINLTAGGANTAPACSGATYNNSDSISVSYFTYDYAPVWAATLGTPGETWRQTNFLCR